MIDNLNTTPQPRRPRFTWRRALFLLVGLVIFGFFIYQIGIEGVTEVIRLNPALLLPAGLSVSLMVFLFVLRWSVLINSIKTGGSRVSPVRLYLYSLSSLVLSEFFAPTATVMAVRTGALTRVEKVPLGDSFFSVLVDKLFDLFLVLVLLVPALLYALGAVGLEAAVAVTVVVLALVSAVIYGQYTLWIGAVERLASAAIALAQRLPFLKRIERIRLLEQLEDGTLRRRLPRSTLLRAYGLTLLGQCGLILRAWLIARAIGIDVPILVIFLGVTISQVGSLLAFTPGGLGAIEIGWTIVLAQAGLSLETISGFVVFHRLFQSLSIGVTWLVMVALTTLMRQPAAEHPT